MTAKTFGDSVVTTWRGIEDGEDGDHGKHGDRCEQTMTLYPGLVRWHSNCYRSRSVRCSIQRIGQKTTVLRRVVIRFDGLPSDSTESDEPDIGDNIDSDHYIAIHDKWDGSPPERWKEGKGTQPERWNNGQKLQWDTTIMYVYIHSRGTNVRPEVDAVAVPLRTEIDCSLRRDACPLETMKPHKAVQK